MVSAGGVLRSKPATAAPSTSPCREQLDAVELTLADYESLFGHPLRDLCEVNPQTRRAWFVRWASTAVRADESSDLRLKSAEQGGSMHGWTGRMRITVAAAAAMLPLTLVAAEVSQAVSASPGATRASSVDTGQSNGVADWTATRAGVFVDTGLRATRLSQVNPRNMAYRASWGLSYPYCNPVLSVRRGSTGGLVRSGSCDVEGLSVTTPVTGTVSGVALKAAATDNMRGSLNSQSVYAFLLYRGRVLIADLRLNSFKSTPVASIRRGRLVITWGRVCPDFG